MEELMKKLREQRDAKLKRMRELIESAAAEERGAFAEEEQAEYDALRSDVTALDERVADLEEEERRERVAAEAAARVESPTVEVLSEPRTYNAEAERRGVSFLRDLITAPRGNAHAQERLARHQRETADIEERATTTGSFTGLVVPQYLTDLVAPFVRAGRPFANICNAHPLPPDGMVVNISRITTGSSAAAQATQNTGVSETNMADTLLAVNVRTIAGMQEVSRQAVERGTGIDAIVMQDLVSAYNATLDNGIINSDGTSGTHLGLRSTGAVNTSTYTDATPTAGELYPKLADIIQQIQTAVFMGMSHFVMHPRRWWWIASQVGQTFPFMQFPASAPQTGGQVGGTDYEGVNRIISGVPVVLDANIPTNLGGGTNEDVILGVTASELHLWEQAGQPLFIRSEEVLANTLTVRFVLYGYTAFTAGRYPKAHGIVSGTGLVAPTFA